MRHVPVRRPDPYVTAGTGASIFYAGSAETVGCFAWRL
jgi:hypothetical protein